MKCLKNRDCDALINTNLDKMKIAIGKKFKIFPMIDKFTNAGAPGLVGPAAIQFLVNKGACDYLINTLETQATQLVSELPRVGHDKVDAQLKKSSPTEGIDKILADEDNFIRNLVNDFAKKTINGEAVPGVE